MTKKQSAPAAINTIYDHQAIEKKWQTVWEDQELFQHSLKQYQQVEAAKKLYLLFAFAYPSGAGLHVGHVESKTALDILARYYRMQGQQVFFPVGWDAFGLPAENYAIKTGVPPAKTTKKAIDTFRRQIKRLAISYDWQTELATCHPGYYQWTQWLFLELYKKGLAYQAKAPVNWCPSCQTVLANEQVVEGACERCDSEVSQKEMKQWFFKITDYQDELLSGLDQVDWPEPTKQQQRHWIGKKQGIEISYSVVDTQEEIVCFTTRPDTNFGATFVVLAPEHQLVSQIIKGQVNLPESVKATAVIQQLRAYVKQAQKKTELERQTEGRKKSGVFTGLYALNPLTNKKMPIWVSDFVLAGFGTGAVVGVPGHDQRDFEFVEFVNRSHPQQQIEVIRVVVGSDGDDSPITQIEQVQEDHGTMINSEFLNGLDIHQAIPKIMDYMEEHGLGKRVTIYKLRDWLISRQRYWGTPIPIVYDPDGKPHPVKKEHLPWLLPTDVDFKPTGESPLRSSKEFIQRTEKLYGKGWRPEFDTMDTFVDSSWYYLRYTDPRNQQEFANPQRLKSWLPVDFYMIGPEHIVLHLLYSRFFTKFLRDQGYLDFDEPFLKMRHQGMILGPDGKKMSKSKGNVINPDKVVAEFGADTLRVYEMFMGPLDADKPWDASSVRGVYRFLRRVYELVIGHLNRADQTSKPLSNGQVVQQLHQTIKKVTDDVPKLKFNTAIAAMMEFVNTWEAQVKDGSPALDLTAVQNFVQLLAPFAPFLAEELWHQIKAAKTAKSVHLTDWPSYDATLAQQNQVTIGVQVNGKLRGELTIDLEEKDHQKQVIAQAKDLSSVQKWLKDRQLVKEIYVPGKIVSLVVK
ncbi:MAG: leucine--tRNA ligase [Candidatus Pacebacteria bacterium]|nr:leucine--tRNA ligase [Candidatus Paceibacterota bacterium]